MGPLHFTGSYTRGVAGNEKRLPKGRSRVKLLEATSGFEPLIEVLQTSALTTWPRRRIGRLAVGN